MAGLSGCGTARTAGGWHVGGALTYAVLHIVGMYGLRALVYTQAGVPYDSGPWQHVLPMRRRRTRSLTRPWR